MTALKPELLGAINEKMDELVELAEQVVETTKIYGRECPKCKRWYPPETKECESCIDRKGKPKTQEIMEEHQLRNLENMANATDSVKALELFVRYQMGRHSEWGYNDFGNRVIEDFGKLKEIASELTQGQTNQTKAVHIQLIRLYLGFLVRAFIARRPRSERDER